MTTTTYDYDEESASNADKAANRIDESNAYVGRIKAAYSKVSERTGTEGVHIDFVSSLGGSMGFDIWTRKSDGTKVFGMDQLQAIMAVLGLRGLKTEPRQAEVFEDRALVKKDVDSFVDLVGKDIGFVFQKELTTKDNGSDGYRMNLYGIFHPKSRLTASEIREKKTTPAKLERMLKGLKDKDSRKPKQQEPAQPSVGADADY